MALFMFGFIGFPPAGIFLGKFYVFSAVVDRGWAWLAIVGVVATAVSVYYYANVIRAMYMQPRELAVVGGGRLAAGRPAVGERGRRRRSRGYRQLRLRRSASRHRHGRGRVPPLPRCLSASSSSAPVPRGKPSLPSSGGSTRRPRWSSSSVSSWAASAPTGRASRRRRCCARSRSSPARGSLPGRPKPSAPVDADRVFWWRDQVAEKDDTSQAEWLASKGAELVRGSGVVAEPGLVTVDGRELPYDALLVATGSVPVVPPIDGLADAPHWGSREATSATSVPDSLVIVGGGASRLRARPVLRPPRHAGDPDPGRRPPAAEDGSRGRRHPCRDLRRGRDRPSLRRQGDPRPRRRWGALPARARGPGSRGGRPATHRYGPKAERRRVWSREAQRLDREDRHRGRRPALGR